MESRRLHAAGRGARQEVESGERQRQSRKFRRRGHGGNSARAKRAVVAMIVVGVRQTQANAGVRVFERFGEVVIGAGTLEAAHKNGDHGHENAELPKNHALVYRSELNSASN